ncbi:spore gernimation protein [Anaerobacillus arseniciselenatis]|uniref:Spore gernimation protein n=1 Tax=Anaerobacillus arseniciselenatis TaxID=85682 RepID=A0A1S2LJN6_9BACI|nr:glycoside hydrolase family 18 protein [Anaerobacillus arseniciselenatis]OIJ12749.1 spore gernimation protein [Anaerobacillus arseniciselenatis]
MQIHTIQPGENLFGIAQAYGTTVEDIVDANEIPEPTRLVEGQTIVIPIIGRFYWVQPGDSLWSIAQRFGINYMTLAQVNQIQPDAALPVGLRLYIPEPPKPVKEVNAYVEPIGDEVGEDLHASARRAVPHLTYLAPFSYEIARDGTLRNPPLEQFPQIAREGQAALMMTVTNLEEGAFSDEVGAIILNDEALQDVLLNTVIEEARRVGYSDIHFDLEFLRPEDREAYNQFLRKAAERIHAEGLLISTALAPKTRADQPGPWYEAHDYRAHGEIVDFVVIMTYEWGYSAGPPMAVSPIGPVREVLEYALTEMPSNKIMMGQNLYGYDWTLPFVPGGEYARALSPQAAIELAKERNVAIEYDYEDQAPHFNYFDDEGNEHKVWFEDARSIQAKFDLLKELDLRGISYWKLGLPFPQNWLLIEGNFEVRKI